jgi:hypothetical protein
MTDQFDSWDALATAVHQWSLANFGTQHGLGCLPPLLGIVEEVREYDEAIDLSEQEDALGDICIFLMDYCKRSGMQLDFPTQFDLTNTDISYWVGQLSHVRLKRIQGIRGMDNIEVFRVKEYEAVEGILAACETTALSFHPDGIFDIACKTFTNVVKKRQWHTQPDKPITFESSCEDFKSMAAELNWGLA